MAETNTENQQETQVYEVAFHIDANLSDTEVKKTFDGVKEAITSNGGTPFAESAPERMDLAYTISHIAEGSRRDHVSAHFAWVAYEGAPENQEAIAEELKGNAAIIRYMVIKTTKEEALYAQDRAAEKMVASDKTDDTVSEDELDEALEETTA